MDSSNFISASGSVIGLEKKWKEDSKNTLMTRNNCNFNPNVDDKRSLFLFYLFELYKLDEICLLSLIIRIEVKLKIIEGSISSVIVSESE